MSNTGVDDPQDDFELQLTYRHEGKFVSHDKIVGKDLVSLLSQFQLVLANVSRRLVENAGRPNDDDDIPF